MEKCVESYQQMEFVVAELQGFELDSPNTFHLYPPALQVTAISEDGFHLFVAASRELLHYTPCFPQDDQLRHNILMPAHRCQLLPSSGHICAIKCAQLCGEAVLLCVVESGQVYVYFYERFQDLKNPLVISTSLPCRTDNSTWSVSVHSFLPLIAVGSNAHVISVVDLMNLDPRSVSQTTPRSTLEYLRSLFLENAAQSLESLARPSSSFPELPQPEIFLAPLLYLPSGDTREGIENDNTLPGETELRAYLYLASQLNPRFNPEQIGDIPQGIVRIYGHRHNIPSVAFAPVPDCPIVASVSIDASLRLWLLQNNRPRFLGGLKLPTWGWKVEWINTANLNEVDWLSFEPLQEILADLLKNGLKEDVSKIITGPPSTDRNFQQYLKTNSFMNKFLSDLKTFSIHHWIQASWYLKVLKDTMSLAVQHLAASCMKTMLDPTSIDSDDTLRLLQPYPDQPFFTQSASQFFSVPLSGRTCYTTVALVFFQHQIDNFATEVAEECFPLFNLRMLCNAIWTPSDATTANFAYNNKHKTEMLYEPSLIRLKPRVRELLPLAFSAIISAALPYHTGNHDFLVPKIKQTPALLAQQEPPTGCVTSTAENDIFWLVKTLCRFPEGAPQLLPASGDSRPLFSKTWQNTIFEFVAFKNATQAVFLLSLRLNSAWLRKRRYFKFYFKRLAQCVSNSSIRQIRRSLWRESPNHTSEHPDVTIVRSVLETILLRGVAVVNDIILNSVFRMDANVVECADDFYQARIALLLLAVTVAHCVLLVLCNVAEALEKAWIRVSYDAKQSTQELASAKLHLEALLGCHQSQKLSGDALFKKRHASQIHKPMEKSFAASSPYRTGSSSFGCEHNASLQEPILQSLEGTESAFHTATALSAQGLARSDAFCNTRLMLVRQIKLLEKRCVAHCSAMARILKLTNSINVLRRIILSQMCAKLLLHIDQVKGEEQPRHPVYMLLLYARQKAEESLHLAPTPKNEDAKTSVIFYTNPEALRPYQCARIHKFLSFSNSVDTPFYLSLSDTSSEATWAQNLRQCRKQSYATAIHPVYCCAASLLFNAFQTKQVSGPEHQQAHRACFPLSDAPLYVPLESQRQKFTLKHLADNMLVLATTTTGMYMMNFVVEYPSSSDPNSTDVSEIRLRCHSVLEVAHLNIWTALPDVPFREERFQRFIHLCYCSHQGIIAIASQSRLPIVVLQVLRCKYTRRPFLLVLFQLPTITLSDSSNTPSDLSPSLGPQCSSLPHYSCNAESFSPFAAAAAAAASSTPSDENEEFIPLGSLASRFPEGVANDFFSVASLNLEDYNLSSTPLFQAHRHNMRPSQPQVVVSQESRFNDNSSNLSAVAGLSMHCEGTGRCNHTVYLTVLLENKNLLRYRICLPAVPFKP